MGAYSRQLLIILFLAISTGCTQNEELPVEDEPFGDLLFTMDCQWQPRTEDSSLWQCQADVDNRFVSGFIVLELMDDNRLAFCGENLRTNTGNDMYDSMVGSYTADRFNCIFVAERVSGNEFDWIWYNGENRLLMIWRPAAASHKYVSLVIDDGEVQKIVEGRAYYREEN
jgi:hypothetical protein